MAKYKKAREMKQSLAAKDFIKAVFYFSLFAMLLPVTISIIEGNNIANTNTDVIDWFPPNCARISCTILPSFYIYELAISTPGFNLAYLVLWVHHFSIILIISIILFTSSFCSPIDYYCTLSITVFYIQTFEYLG